MTVSNLTRILLLSAATGLAACSTDASRFGDFYADAIPQGGRTAGIDYTTTASVPPGNVPPRPGAAVGLPAPTFGVQGGYRRAQVPSAPYQSNVYAPAPQPVATAAPVRVGSVAARPLEPAPLPPASQPMLRDAVDANPIPLSAPSASAPSRTSIAERVRAALPRSAAPSHASTPPSAPSRAMIPTDVAALNRVVTAKPPVASPTTPPQGWTGGKGATVTVREGETLYNLSKRFGIPVASIMAANGIDDVRGVAAGRTLTIPTYNYSERAPISAPDANPDVRAANAALGMRGEPIGMAIPMPAARRPVPRRVALTSPSAAPILARVPERPDANEVRAAPIGQATSGTIMVGQGDTLYSLSRRANTSVAALREANGLTTDAIRVGQVLRIPGGAASTSVPVRAPVVVATPTAPSVSTAPTATVETASLSQASVTAAPSAPAVVRAAPPSLPRTNPRPEPVVAAPVSAPPTAATGTGMRWPVNGRVVEDFGGASKGIAISAPTGSPIRSAENGKIIYAGSGLKELGKTVLVQHDNGLVTVYGYADELRVAKGQTVARGDVLALSGMTGQAKTPSVHFQVRKGSTPVDPTGFLN